MSAPRVLANMEAVTKHVQRIEVGPDTGMYFCEEMSFDEADRDLAYVDHIMSIWQAWRDYVVEHGEKK